MTKKNREDAPHDRDTQGTTHSDENASWQVELCTTLGYHFADKTLLEIAVTHRSFANENRCDHNERLEFLGDAVLGLVVAQRLFADSPHAREGVLSQKRAALVQEDTLAMCARNLTLGGFLRLGEGESADGGDDKPSILSDAVEAIIGAAYIDGGLGAAQTIIANLLPQKAPRPMKDAKSLLQELAQKHWSKTPAYLTSAITNMDSAIVAKPTEGPPPKFYSTVVIDDTTYSSGQGPTKKMAEQKAASNTLRDLGWE